MMARSHDRPRSERINREDKHLECCSELGLRHSGTNHHTPPS